MPKTRIVSPFPVFESIQETPHRQKGALSPFNCISIPQSRVCGKEKPFRICKFLLRWCVLFYVFSDFFHFFRKKGLLFLLGFGIVYKSQGHARLAQLVEHLLDVQEVTGSSPVPRTIENTVDSLKSTVFSFVSTHFSTHLPIFFASRAPNPYTRPVLFLLAHP